MDGDGASYEDERKRLELEKLRLETESLQRKRDLEVQKLEHEIEEMRRAPKRATIFSSATALLGLGTLVLGAAGFVGTATANRTAAEQHAFETYSTLTDEFSRTGAPKIRAIAGFRGFLEQGSDRASQTAAILANDMWVERDPSARAAIEAALQDGGAAAFDQVRQIHLTSRAQLDSAARNYATDEAWMEFKSRQPRERRTRAPDLAAIDAWQNFAPAWLQMNEFYRAALFQAANAELRRRNFPDPSASVLTYLEPEIQRSSGLWAGGVPYETATTQQWLTQYAGNAPAFVLSSKALASMLGRAALPRGLDASQIDVVDVHLNDANLSEMNLFMSTIAGDAYGIDLSNADLRFAGLEELSLSKSETNRASLCGANLRAAKIAADFYVTARKTPDDLPDLTGADWWHLDSIPVDVRLAIELRFPRAEQEAFRALPRVEQVRRCAERRTAVASPPLPSRPERGRKPRPRQLTREEHFGLTRPE